MRSPRIIALAGLFAGTLAVGCRSADRASRAPEGMEAAAPVRSAAPAIVEASVPPMALDERTDSVWSYLKEKYDADGDGLVSRAEYTRNDGTFARLDHDDDGAIGPKDFEGGSRAEMMREMRAQMAIIGYFQLDDDAEKLSLDELEGAVEQYDADADGLVSQAEFDAVAPEHKTELESRMARMMSSSNPWEALVQGLDENGDGALADAEFVSFFERRDDGDGVWSLNMGRGRQQGGERPKTGALQGTVAPDFTLEPPHGGDAVTLSSFRGEKPVALIFGSYT